MDPFHLCGTISSHMLLVSYNLLTERTRGRICALVHPRHVFWERDSESVGGARFHAGSACGLGRPFWDTYNDGTGFSIGIGALYEFTALSFVFFYSSSAPRSTRAAIDL